MLLSLLRRHHRRLHHLRHHSTTTTPPTIPLTHPTYFIWSANTSLGKTLISTGLAASFLHSPTTPQSSSRNFLTPSPHSSSRKFLYLKPLQTGFPSDSDSHFLFSRLSSLALRHNSPLSASNHILHPSPPAAAALRSFDAASVMERFGRGGKGVDLVCKTLFAWNEAVSPHLAAEKEGMRVEDSVVVESLGNCVVEGDDDGVERGRLDKFCVVETAGGVASPGPSGTLQCDLYRPFRLPAVLVGDGKLGGISATISAYESLTLRGYDIVAVVLEDHGLGNKQPISSYLRDRVPVFVLPAIPQDMSDDLMGWYAESSVVFDSLKEVMLLAYSERIKRLCGMQKKAGEIFWWPFTQHKLVPDESVTVIDSRCGENFSVFKNDFISPQFDACASWWTQGPNAAMQTELARDMGYAAARFGHVMFPENVHEPALECAELLLDSVGRGWASRVYFSDNGSTAIEIALKMAFRKFSSDHGILSDYHKNKTAETCKELMVLALKGSYHGDTLGAMEAQAPSSYTGFLQQPWYTGRGFFLDPPMVFIHDGVWRLSLPEGFHSQTLKPEDSTFSLRSEVFCKSRDESCLARIYSSYISQQISQYSGSGESVCIGALILEPIIQGAGGMHMVDPLFQRVLVNECRKQKIPVIFDEIFTGFWRLGVETATELLHCVPHISCFGKLMTGGIIPLAATLATDAIFDTFFGDSKLEALLHGHSYSAHPMGCTAAAKSIKWFRNPQTNINLTPGGGALRELWDDKLVNELSRHPVVRRVVALGTLFALELNAEGQNAGYGSLFARSLLQTLRDDGVYMRPLGNVIYLMCGPCTPPETCKQLLVKLYRRLEEFSQTNGK